MNSRRTVTSSSLASRAPNVHRHALLCLILLIAVLQRPASASPDASPTASRETSAAPSHGATGIAWYNGDVNDAFESARSNNKLVLLYWGAKWCPPCQQLKSFVFTRRDFIEKSKQFVAVYLDGDDHGAQKWGERFHVAGYPTVVILRPDQVEVTRLSGGVDLSMYAELLDTAMSDVRPIREILSTLRTNPQALSAGDCRRAAYYPWDDGDSLEPDSKVLAASLNSAAHRCTSLNATERARLTVSSAALAPSPETTTQVIAIVHDVTLASSLVDVLEGLGEPFFTDVQSRGPAIVAQFQADWVRTMDHVSNDAAVVDSEQLYAISTKLDVVKQFATDHKVPPDLATAARARVATALAKKVDPYVRSSIVNSASHIYSVLDDDKALYDMLQAEVLTAKAPFYYMDDLGEVEEKRGNTAAALDWYARAYRESTGTATRFQWGFTYLTALLRLAPKDHQKIRSVGIEVIAELNGPDRIHARTRSRLGKLDVALRKWNSNHAYDTDIGALHAHMHSVCGKLPKNDGGLDSCLKFLS